MPQIKNAAWRTLFQNLILDKFQKQQLFLCCQKRLPFEYAMDGILKYAALHPRCVWQAELINLALTQHNDVCHFLYQSGCKHRRNFALPVFFFNVIGIAAVFVRLRCCSGVTAFVGCIHSRFQLVKPFRFASELACQAVKKAVRNLTAFRRLVDPDGLEPPTRRL